MRGQPTRRFLTRKSSVWAFLFSKDEWESRILLYSLCMPEGEREPHIPSWAEHERLHDMTWIGENLHVFWPSALAGYEQLGRGAITVDTTIQPVPGRGHPMWYLTQTQVGEHFGPDEIRLVGQYEPQWQFVVVLLKQENKVSSYRLGVPEQNLR